MYIRISRQLRELRGQVQEYNYLWWDSSSVGFEFPYFRYSFARVLLLRLQ